MKIFLILANAELDPFRKQYPFTPLILPILKSCAPEHEYSFIDMMCEDLSMLNYDGEYDLIALSFRVSATEGAYKIADEFRKRNKRVVMGGPQVSGAPLKAKEHADSVVIGEAEFLWPVLLDDFKKNMLKDFYVSSPAPLSKLEGFQVYNLPELPDISKLPIPDRSIIKKSYTFDVIFAARGCPVNCSFCAVSSLFGTKMRYKDIPLVIEEIKTLGKKFFLLDDNVLGRNDSYSYYTELYKELAKIPEKRFWTGQANLNAAASPKGREVIKYASVSGLTYAAVGFETINKSDMQNMSTTPKMGVDGSDNFMEQISNNIRFIQEQGIAISAWFTIGLKHDTVESINDAITFCINHYIFPVLTPIQALEGTRFYDEMKAGNHILDNKTNVSNVNISVLKNIDKIILLESNLKRAYTFGNLLRNTWFYFKKNRKLKRSNYETIYRTIFIIATQLKMRKFIKKDLKRFKLRMTNEI